MVRRNLSLDAGLAALVFLGTVGVLASRGFGTPGPETRELDPPGVLLAMVSTLPLAVRRLAPLTVYLITSAASVALAALAYPLDVPLGPLFAVYTLALAYSGDPRPTRRRGGLLTANLFVPAIALAYAQRGGEVWEIGPALLAWALVFVGVWIAADRTRLRAERMAELEERAARVHREAERERRLAAAEERTRIARELHDSAGHAINVILIQAGAARLLHERDPDGARRSLAVIEDVARDTIGEIDRMVRALRDDGGTPESPAPADPAVLEELVERHRAGGLSIATDVRGPRRALPRSVAWAAYRILQEALTNVARHGHGSADVAVAFGAEAVEITVTNPTTSANSTISNGATVGGGHGIVGMRERASLLGGTLTAQAERGVFRLHAWLPVGEAVR